MKIVCFVQNSVEIRVFSQLGFVFRIKCMFLSKTEDRFRSGKLDQLELELGARLAEARLNLVLFASGHHQNICSSFLKLVFTSSSSWIHI